MWSFNLRVALLGLLSFSAGVSLTGCASDQCCAADAAGAACCEQTPLAVNDLPPAVEATARAEAGGAAIESAATCSTDGEKCYCITTARTGGGDHWCLCIDGSGKLMKKERMTGKTKG